MSRNRMLILRLSAIGDVAMTVHAVKALRQAYPDLEITVGTRKRLAGFFADVPDLEFIFLPDKATFADLKEFTANAKAMDFGYVADIQNNLRTTYVRLALCSSKCKVASYDQMTYAKWRVKRGWKKDLTPLRNNVLRFCDVFKKLGFEVPDPTVQKMVKPMPECFGKKEGTWIGVAPFSRKEKKIYPLDSMAEVIRLLSKKYDKVFIFSGPGKEKTFCDQMMDLYPNVESVFGRTDFIGETALISNLDALVTMDSATMHMASLNQAPFVCIWGGTHPSTGYSAYGADWDKNYLQLDMPCRPCSSYGEGKCKFGDFRCLNNITPEMVVNKVAALIESKN